jgi:hypothetical protein
VVLVQGIGLLALAATRDSVRPVIHATFRGQKKHSGIALPAGCR